MLLTFGPDIMLKLEMHLFHTAAAAAAVDLNLDLIVSFAHTLLGGGRNVRGCQWMTLANTNRVVWNSRTAGLPQQLLLPAVCPYGLRICWADVCCTS